MFASAKPGEDLRGAQMRFMVALFGGQPRTQEVIVAARRAP